MPTKKHTTENKDAKVFLEKIVLNAGVGRASTTQPNFEEKVLTQITKDLSAIAGQKPQVRRAKKSIAGFKMREGQIVGLRTTLRGRKMIDFFERMNSIVFPRVRDFNGLNVTNIDDHGILNIGFKEQYVFPEINPEESTFTFPLGVNVVPKAKNKTTALEEFRRLGVPMKKNQ